MNKCDECGSYAINHHCHGRDGSDPNLCDVCYWRKRATYPVPATVPSVNQQLLEALTDSLELMETLCAFEGDTIRKARAAIAAARKEGGKV